MRRFPYSVFYAVKNDAVHILAVQHGHRDPRTWPGEVKEPAPAWVA